MPVSGGICDSRCDACLLGLGWRNFMQWFAANLCLAERQGLLQVTVMASSALVCL